MPAITGRSRSRREAVVTSGADALDKALAKFDASVHTAVGKRRRWLAAELRYLETWAGIKSMGELCLHLKRSERALRCQLHRQGLSAKVREGWGLEQLRVDLHLHANKVLRHAVHGVLRVQNAQVCIQRGLASASSRTMRSLPINEAARALGWSHTQILIAALAGRCQLINVRISEMSVMRLESSHAFEPMRERLHPAVDGWLAGHDQAETKSNAPPCIPSHLGVMHRCNLCGRRIRGIAFFRHRAHCVAAAMNRTLL